MKAYLTLILTTAIGIIECIGQQDTINYYQQLLIEKTPHAREAHAFDKIAEAYFEINTDSTLKYARKAINIGKQLKDSTILANGYNKLGVGLTYAGKYTQALDTLFTALWMREHLRDTLKLSASWGCIGNVYLAQGITHEEKRNDSSAKGMYKLAFDAYSKGLAFGLTVQDSFFVSMNLQNLGSAYYRLYEYEKAIKYFDLGYQWTLSATKHIYQTEYLNNIAVVMSYLDDIALLTDNHELMVSRFKEYRQYIPWISYNLNLASTIWQEQPKFTESLLLEADSISSAFKYGKYQQMSTKNLYLWYKDLLQYELSLHYYEKYNKLVYEANLVETEAKINELSLKYDNEKTAKDLAIEKVNHQETEADRNRLFTALIGVATLLLGLGIFTIQRLRINRLKREQIQQRHQKEITDLLQSQELKSIEAMLNGQDKERKRIAQDLHDRLGSILSATKMYFESIIPDNLINSEKGKKAYHLLDEAIDQARIISHNLTSGVLSKFGFTAALEDLKQTIEGSGALKATLEINHSTKRFSAETEINLYRIIQEAVSNILKHAEASHILIQLNKADSDQCILSIHDNGRGFNTEALHHGIGLKNMRARALKFNGNVTISSSLKKGTTVLIIFNPDNQ